MVAVVLGVLGEMLVSSGSPCANFVKLRSFELWTIVKSVASKMFIVLFVAFAARSVVTGAMTGPQTPEKQPVRFAGWESFDEKVSRLRPEGGKHLDLQVPRM